MQKVDGWRFDRVLSLASVSSYCCANHISSYRRVSVRRATHASISLEYRELAIMLMLFMLYAMSYPLQQKVLSFL